MPAYKNNPYDSPVVTADEYHGLWNVVPAFVSFLIGAASVGFGLFVVLVIAYAYYTRQSQATAGGMIIGWLCIGFGASWLIAGWHYATRRFRRGLVATGFGVMLFIVLIVFGWL